MGFAAGWLAEKALFPPLFDEIPDDDLGIIVSIPSYNEPDLSDLLNSLASCDVPDCKVEILIVINAKQDADSIALSNNLKCIEHIQRWKSDHPDCFFRICFFDTGIPSFKNWGVGFARKTGMDEALRRFSLIDNPEGVIVCLDADCTVAKNYFTSIENTLLKNRNNRACSIYFEHPLNGSDLREDIVLYITLYELHLRYYLWALKFTGFPYAFYTVGSALAVKAHQYMKAGGMNRRQAGEDFYFIQKLVSSGGYFNLNATTVYPSPRESLRVPFGTGATMAKMIESPGRQFLTYNFNAFEELGSFFREARNLYKATHKESERFYGYLPSGLRSFISEKEWGGKIEEINANTAGNTAFIKRFHEWFNMFRIVKYLNHVHNIKFERQPVPESACILLKASGHKIISNEPSDLLRQFRLMDKNS